MKGLKRKISSLENRVCKEVMKNKKLKDDAASMRLLVEYRKGPRGHVRPVKGYMLAKKRTLGHASAECTALVAAGEEHQGSVKSKNTVLKYEHRYSLCKAMLSWNNYKEIDDFTSWEFHQCQFDATNQGLGSRRVDLLSSPISKSNFQPNFQSNFGRFAFQSNFQAVRLHLFQGFVSAEPFR